MPRGVGGGEDENAVVAALDAVQLGEELVDELAPGALAHIAAAGAEGVDFIEEQDARLMIPRLFEHLVEIAFALANPHVENIVDANGHEARSNFTRGGAGQICFAATRRAIHQNAAADGFAVSLIKVRMGERMDDLHPDFLLELLHAADILKLDLGALDGGVGRSGGFFPRTAHPAFDHFVLFRLRPNSKPHA